MHLEEFLRAENFYNYVKSQEEMREFLSTVGKSNATFLNIDVPQIAIFDEQMYEENKISNASVIRGLNQIFINPRQFIAFEELKKKKNPLFPYLLTQTISHESKHLDQNKTNVEMFSTQHKKLDKNNISYDDVFNIYEQLTLKSQPPALKPEELFKKYNDKDLLVGIALQATEILMYFNDFQNQYNDGDGRLTYKNNPAEIEAREYGANRLFEIYKKSKDKNILFELANYAGSERHVRSNIPADSYLRVFNLPIVLPILREEIASKKDISFFDQKIIRQIDKVLPVADAFASELFGGDFEKLKAFVNYVKTKNNGDLGNISNKDEQTTLEMQTKLAEREKALIAKSFNLANKLFNEFAADGTIVSAKGAESKIAEDLDEQRKKSFEVGAELKKARIKIESEINFSAGNYKKGLRKSGLKV